MVRRGDRLLVAVSGGPDSVALLHLLKLLAPSLDLQLRAAHVHHGLRGAAADRDARFVSDLAASLGVPFTLCYADVRTHADRHRLCVEEAGRRLRYGLLEEVAAAAGCGPVATGHQADDNAESVLLFLLRGSGLPGVSGIAPVRKGRWIRPMLDIGREEILAFLHGAGHPFVQDASNQDRRYMRNRIRIELMPLLRSRFAPKIRDRLAAFSRIVAEEDRWIEETVGPLLRAAVLESSEDRMVLSGAELARQPRPVQRRMLRGALSAFRGSLRGIDFAAVERGLSLVRPDAPAAVCLPGGTRMVREAQNRIVLCRASTKRQEAANPFSVAIPGPGAYRLPGMAGMMQFSAVSPPGAETLHTAGHRVAFFDMSTIQFPLTVRNFRPGDRFRPLGLNGTQKVKKYFIDRKVPRSQRSRTPLVVCGDDVVWIAGQRMDDRVRITPSTRTALRIEWLPADGGLPLRGNGSENPYRRR